LKAQAIDRIQYFAIARHKARELRRREAHVCQPAGGLHTPRFVQDRRDTAVIEFRVEISILPVRVL
jgi:hypothetical protein